MIATPLLIIHTTTMKEIVTYCGEEVELLEIIQGPKSNSALIRFEDGREDEVPVSTIKF